MTIPFISFSHSPDKHYYVYIYFTFITLLPLKAAEQESFITARQRTLLKGEVFNCVCLSLYLSVPVWPSLMISLVRHRHVQTCSLCSTDCWKAGSWHSRLKCLLTKHQTGIAVLSPLEVTFYQRQRKVLFPQASVILFLWGLYDVTSCVWSHGPS